MNARRHQRENIPYYRRFGVPHSKSIQINLLSVTNIDQRKGTRNIAIGVANTDTQAECIDQPSSLRRENVGADLLCRANMFIFRQQVWGKIHDNSVSHFVEK